MQYLIIDLEATCWEKGTAPARMEIIEIGAVLLPCASAEVAAEFSRFVRPVAEPLLSEFCTRLTGIAQEDVSSAEDFPVVLSALLEWIGSKPVTWASWGAYDLRQFQVDCSRHRTPFPEALTRHINLKATFAEQQGIPPCGMRGALRRLNIPLDGQHHRALDDARNIAKLARVILPRVEAP